MFCEKCGNKMNDDANFCTRCGHAVARVTEETPNEPEKDGIAEEEQLDEAAETDEISPAAPDEDESILPAEEAEQPSEAAEADEENKPDTGSELWKNQEAYSFDLDTEENINGKTRRKLVIAVTLSFAVILSVFIFVLVDSNSIDTEQITDSTRSATYTTAAAQAETTTFETTQSTDAADYIPGPQEAYELLKPLYAEHGYDFDSWKIYSNTDELYQLVGPNEEQTVLIGDAYLFIRTSEKDDISITYESESSRLKSIVMRFKNGVDPYDLCDAILTNCPDDYKLSGEYLKNHINEVINNGTAKWEKNGLVYSIITSASNTGALVFSIYLES